jgi:hypothetical protein
MGKEEAFELFTQCAKTIGFGWNDAYALIVSNVHARTWFHVGSEFAMLAQIPRNMAFLLKLREAP